MKHRIVLLAALSCIGLTLARADEVPLVIAVEPAPAIQILPAQNPEIVQCYIFKPELDNSPVGPGSENCGLPIPCVPPDCYPPLPPDCVRPPDCNLPPATIDPETTVTNPVIIVDPTIIDDPVAVDPGMQHPTGGPDPVVVDTIGGQSETDAQTSLDGIFYFGGPEVQRAVSLADPSLATVTATNAPEAGLSAAAATAGTESANALQIEAAGAAIVAKRELTVTRSGGEVIIGD